MDKLIGIIALTLHDYLRYRLSRRPRPPAAHCALCGKPAAAVQRLIPGATGLAVCNECVLRCYAAIAANKPEESTTA